MRQKKNGKTDLKYEDWYINYEPYKRVQEIEMDKNELREALEDWFFDKLKTTFTPGEIKLLIDEYKQKKKDLGKEKKDDDDEV